MAGCVSNCHTFCYNLLQLFLKKGLTHIVKKPYIVVWKIDKRFCGVGIKRDSLEFHFRGLGAVPKLRSNWGRLYFYILLFPDIKVKTISLWKLEENHQMGSCVKDCLMSLIQRHNTHHCWFPLHYFEGLVLSSFLISPSYGGCLLLFSPLFLFLLQFVTI